MRREEYIEELKTHLHGLQASEIEEALSYCEEYFDEAEEEQKAMEDLGSPAEFASQLKTEAAFKTTKNPENYRKPHSMLKSFFMIFGGICALPIALPLLLVAVLLLVVFGLVLFILVIAGFILVFALFYAAIASLIASFLYGQGVADIVMQSGISLMFLGFAILATMAVTVLIRRGVPFFVVKLSDFYDRYKKGGMKHEV